MAEREFSKRLGFAPSGTGIKFRKSAPESFRSALLQLAVSDEQLADEPFLRRLVCEALKKLSSPEVDPFEDCQAMIRDCEWYRVYDLVEVMYRNSIQFSLSPEHFTADVNRLFEEEGIGWKLEDGRVISRGDEGFESQIKKACSTLTEAGLKMATTELTEAISDLSRRPEPDLTGAIQHAVAAMECVAREFCGDPKSTFGQLVKRHPKMLPPPLDISVDKAWTYANDMARHITEGRPLQREEAELLVGIAGSVSTYLTQKRVQQQNNRTGS